MRRPQRRQGPELPVEGCELFVLPLRVREVEYKNPLSLETSLWVLGLSENGFAEDGRRRAGTTVT